MPIFSQFGEIVWQRLLNIVRISQWIPYDSLGYNIKVVKDNVEKKKMAAKNCAGKCQLKLLKKV